MYRDQLSQRNTIVLFDALHSVASHAHQIDNDTDLRSKLQDLGSMTQMQDPPLLRLENEAYQICLTLLQNLISDQSSTEDATAAETHLINLCREVLEVYLDTASSGLPSNAAAAAAAAGGQAVAPPQWVIPLGSAKRRELAARAPLVVAALQAICGLGDSSFEKNLAKFFPLLSGLIRCEHGSSEVQAALSDMLSSCVGPVLLKSC